MAQITEALLSKYGLRNAFRGWALLLFLAAILACSYNSRAHVEKDKALTMEEKQPPAEVPSSVLRNSSFMIYLTSLSLLFFVVFTPSIYMVRQFAWGARAYVLYLPWKGSFIFLMLSLPCTIIRHGNAAFLSMEDNLKTTELFVNNDVTIILLFSPLKFIILNTNSKWPVIVASQFSPAYCWRGQ